MVNGIQLSFFSNYIYNPKTWFHTISVKDKVLIMSIYLIIIPYLPLSLLVLLQSRLHSFLLF